MTISTQEKKQAIKSFAQHEKDLGSTQVQCAILTTRISNLTAYCNIHKKDVPAKRKLLQLAARRRRFLKYLKRKDNSAYNSLITALSIRAV